MQADKTICVQFWGNVGNLVLPYFPFNVAKYYITQHICFWRVFSKGFLKCEGINNIYYEVLWRSCQVKKSNLFNCQNSSSLGAWVQLAKSGDNRIARAVELPVGLTWPLQQEESQGKVSRLVLSWSHLSGLEVSLINLKLRFLPRCSKLPLKIFTMQQLRQVSSTSSSLLSCRGEYFSLSRDTCPC